MLFPPYEQTKVAYHVVDIKQLKDILEQGIKMKEKINFSNDKYHEFNIFLDENRPKNIPQWVKREKAFFATINFKEDIKWHSHSALLAIKLREEKCWVANENLANEIYDPYVLQYIKEFDNAKEYMNKQGQEKAVRYWEQSFQFSQYNELQMKNKENYDAEIMIFHDIEPSEIHCLMIATDHQQFSPIQWQRHYELGGGLMRGPILGKE